jgi:hypothetical protein
MKNYFLSLNGKKSKTAKTILKNNGSGIIDGIFGGLFSAVIVICRVLWSNQPGLN